MNMQQFAKSKNVTYEEFKNLEDNINRLAAITLENIKKLHKIDTGMYYPVNEIIHYNSDHNTKAFLIVALKKIGVEFIENNSLYRY